MPMVNKKTRRHSGRYTPKLVDRGMKYSEIKENCLEPQEEYDDWSDYRDGMRDLKYLRWKQRDKKKMKTKWKIKN